MDRKHCGARKNNQGEILLLCVVKILTFRRFKHDSNIILFRKLHGQYREGNQITRSNTSSIIWYYVQMIIRLNLPFNFNVCSSPFLALHVLRFFFGVTINTTAVSFTRHKRSERGRWRKMEKRGKGDHYFAPNKKSCPTRTKQLRSCRTSRRGRISLQTIVILVWRRSPK